MLREWVVEGGGLDGCFGEQGLPAGIPECLERFHRRCVDCLSRQFVPKWDCPNGDGELATARSSRTGTLNGLQVSTAYVKIFQRVPRHGFLGNVGCYHPKNRGILNLAK